MKRKSVIVPVMIATVASIIGLFALRGARVQKLTGEQTASPAESTQTSWEGRWEVPVIEGDEQSRSFTLAKNKHFHVRVNEAVTEFREGDVVNVLWEPGKVYINDMQVQPYPGKRTILSAVDVRTHYGQVPVVRDYLSKHRGEASEDEVATRAVELWYAKCQEVVRGAEEQYRYMLAKAQPRKAADVAREFIQASGLADSTAVRLDPPAESEAQELDVLWKGQRGQPGAVAGISLRNEDSQMPPDTVTAKRLYAKLTEMLDLLTYGDNELSVRYEGGSVLLEGAVVPRPEGGKP